VGVTFKPLLTYSNKYTTQITIRTLIGLGKQWLIQVTPGSALGPGFGVFILDPVLI
jgi:hypothetical protein